MMLSIGIQKRTSLVDQSFSMNYQNKIVTSKIIDFIPQKGGDPAAPSDTATLLRLHPSYWFCLRRLPPYGWVTGVGPHQLPWCDGRCVQDPGTYSPRHSDSRLLAIPTSCSRVADYNPNWDCFFEVCLLSRGRFPLQQPLQHVCSPKHKGHDDLTSSPPSSRLSLAVSLECPPLCAGY